MDATIFALAVGLVVGSLVIIAALCRRAKENYQLEAADLAEKIRVQRECRARIPRKCIPILGGFREVREQVPAGLSIGEQVLTQVTFEKHILSEALKIVNKEK